MVKNGNEMQQSHRQKTIHSTYATLEKSREKSTPEAMTAEINPKDINNFHYSKGTVLISYKDQLGEIRGYHREVHEFKTQE